MTRLNLSPLEPAELKYLESQRHDVIKEQARTVLRIIKRHRTNANALKKELHDHQFPENKNLKPEALELALMVMNKRKDLFSEEIYRIVEDILIERRIGSVKIDRSLQQVGENDESARLVHKLPKGKEDNNRLKQNNLWVQRDIEEKTGLEGGHVCNIIGSNLANVLMGDNSPRVRLHKDMKGEVTLLSTLPGLSLTNVLVKNKSPMVGEFHTLEEVPEDDRAEFVKDAKGFANFFATNVLTGNYGFSPDNVGLRVDKNMQNHWALLNNNRALSYNKVVNFQTDELYSIDALQHAISFKNSMTGYETLYPEARFSGLGFACELNKAISNIDEKKLRKVIKLSMDNLREAYGNNFLTQPNINKELKDRMGFVKTEDLTEQLIEDKIIDNIHILQEQLKQIAEQEFSKAILESGYVDKHRHIDYKHFFEVNKTPENLDLFMKIAIQADDFEGIKYLKGLNKRLKFDEIKVDGVSPLEYALKEEHNELAAKMIQAGFSLNKKSESKIIEEQQNVEAALLKVAERRAKHSKSHVQDIIEQRKKSITGRVSSLDY